MLVTCYYTRNNNVLLYSKLFIFQIILRSIRNRNYSRALAYLNLSLIITHLTIIKINKVKSFI